MGTHNIGTPKGEKLTGLTVQEIKNKQAKIWLVADKFN